MCQPLASSEAAEAVAMAANCQQTVMMRASRVGSQEEGKRHATGAGNRNQETRAAVTGRKDMEPDHRRGRREAASQIKRISRRRP